MQTSMLVQPRRITKPKIPPDPSPIPATTLIAAADQVLPITTDHVPVSPMHEDIPSTTAGSLTAPAAACLEPPQFSLQSGLYQPSTPEAILAVQLAMERCYTQVGTEKEKAIVEENEDQSIPFMEEQHISLVQHLVPFIDIWMGGLCITHTGS